MTDCETTWHAFCPEADFPEDGKLSKEIGGWSVLVVRAEDGLHSFNDRCTHQASRLSPGRVRRGAIMCPLHGARFEVKTGRCLGGSYENLRTFAVRVADGLIEVAVPNAAPGPNERPVNT